MITQSRQRRKAVKINAGRYVSLIGEIDDFAAAAFQKRVFKLLRKDSRSPLAVFVNCQGGYVTTGLGLYDMLRCLPCPLIMVGQGQVQSTGLTVFLAAERKYRWCHEHTMFMGHQCSVEKAAGTTEHLFREVQDMKRKEEMYAKIISERTGRLSEARVRTWLYQTGYDTVFYADEAKRNGIVGKIITGFDGLVDWNDETANKSRCSRPTSSSIIESRMINSGRNKVR